LIFAGAWANIARIARQRPELNPESLKQTARKELALFVGFLFFGFVLMPAALYLIGQDVFGEYGGRGYGDFFGTLSAKIRGGEKVAWFFVLSPYLAWQILRLTRYGWRLASPPPR
jgi:hypothetical protein